jgi:hypothetical protein
MIQDLSADETTVLGTYSNRSDAEVAKARLADREIDAVIVADDVHPPFQLTEGVELRVLEGEAERARQVLSAETAGAVEGETSMETPSGSAQKGGARGLTFGRNGFVQATAWTYVAAFLLMVAIILTGLLVGL